MISETSFQWHYLIHITDTLRLEALSLGTLTLCYISMNCCQSLSLYSRCYLKTITLNTVRMVLWAVIQQHLAISQSKSKSIDSEINIEEYPKFNEFINGNYHILMEHSTIPLWVICVSCQGNLPRLIANKLTNDFIIFIITCGQYMIDIEYVVDASGFKYTPSTKV